jgi:hypothetical protein
LLKQSRSFQPSGVVETWTSLKWASRTMCGS